MNDEPRTRDAIIARYRAAAERLDAALGSLSDEELLAPRAAGSWSKRDVITHIAADQRWWTGQLVAAMEGRAPTAEECFRNPSPPRSEHDLSTQEGRNAAQHELYRDQPLAEVKDALTHYRERIIELTAALPDSEFDRAYAIIESGMTGRVRPAEEGEQGFPLWQWFRGNTWHHYEDHLKDIEAAARR